ncbi:16323_t:CDS:1, partial [Acaulospora morrowiae]
FTPEALQAFLEKCKAPIKELYLTNHINLVDAHLEYLTQYAIKKETLKKLGVSSYCSLTGEALREASEVMMVTRYGVRLLSLVGRR